MKKIRANVSVRPPAPSPQPAAMFEVALCEKGMMLRVMRVGFVRLSKKARPPQCLVTGIEAASCVGIICRLL